jgi:outer membrane receptor protein involved in Fe transport
MTTKRLNSKVKRSATNRHLGVTTVAAAVAAILAGPRVTWAQTANATLQGMAPANAEVVATNKDTGFSRKTKAGADGAYTLLGLPPGRYVVSAGKGTEQDVVLSVATTSTLDLAQLETVVVTGRRLVEVKTSQVSNVVSLHEIQTVPQLTRNFLEFADTVPGAIFNVAPNGATTFRSGADAPDSVNIFIDGVGQKGYVRSGQSGQSDGSQGNPFPQLAIQEYKVITSNYGAEFDQLSSAAIAAVTKSGTNELHGELFGTYSSDSLRAMTPSEVAANNKVQSKDKEYGFAIGGPIIQDKMHYFVTYEGKRYSQPVAVTYANSPPAAVIAALPASVQAQVGPSSIPFTEKLVFGKIDYEPTDADRFELSAKTRQEDSTGNGAGVGQAPSTATITRNTDFRYELRWQRTADRWFNDAFLTQENAFFRPRAQNYFTNGANYTYVNGPNDTGIINTGSPDVRATQDKGQKGIAFQDDLTFSDVNLGHGKHTIKMGVKYKLVELTAVDACASCYPVFNYNVDPVTGVESDANGAVPYQATFASPPVAVGGQPLASGLAKSKDRQFGIYFQDDWKVNSKLTLNLGVRWDVEWNPTYLDWKTPDFVRNLFTQNSPTPGLDWVDYYKQGPYGFDVNNYFSNGSQRKAYMGEIQPRLGFSYDIRGDQTLVLLGGAGRSYDRNLFDYLQLEQTKLASSVPSVHFNTTSHPCTVDGVSCLNWNQTYLNGPGPLQSAVAGTVGDVFLFNNNLKVPYSDQFSLGIRSKLGDWNTSAIVSRINAHDGFTFLVGNRGPNGAYFVQEPWGGYGTPWDVAQGLYTPVGMTNNLVLSSNGVEIRSTQLLLGAEKPFTKESGWGLKLSYTFTQAETNSIGNDQGGNFTNTEFSVSYPTMSTYPFLQSTNAPKHRLVASGSLQLPWDMILGGKLTLATPTPGWDSSCRQQPASGPPNLGPLGQQCDDVTLVPRQVLIAYKSLDLQLTKDFKFADSYSAYLRLDLLNVTNEANLVNQQTQYNADGTVASHTYNPTGNIANSPRTLRLTIGGKF